MSIPSRLAAALTALVLLTASFEARAADDPRVPEPSQQRPAHAHYNLEDRSLALDGYDPVAYFPEGGGKPVEGDSALTVTHGGVRYRFANAKNRDLFRSDPSRFEPAYGGWCAWAMSQDEGEKTDIDPTSYVIQEGRLMVFYDGLWGDTRAKWKKGDVAKLARAADANWKRITGEAPVVPKSTPAALAGWYAPDGVALAGYDPVAFFAEKSAAVRGSAAHEVRHRGLVFRFSSAAHRAAFEASPARYLPRFGGWDATAMLEGKTVDPDPRHFAVIDGRLVVFASAEGRTRWMADAAARSKTAEAKWSARQS